MMGTDHLSTEQRLWAKVERTESCWLWLGYRDRKGYGRVYDSRDRKDKKVHRLAYEFTHGPIPEGLTIDHLCRVPNCVNPDHLEVVSGAENTRRGAAIKTHCKQGHPFVRTVRGQRRCDHCDLDATHRYRTTEKYLARRAAQIAERAAKRKPHCSPDPGPYRFGSGAVSWGELCVKCGRRLRQVSIGTGFYFWAHR